MVRVIINNNNNGLSEFVSASKTSSGTSLRPGLSINSQNWWRSKTKEKGGEGGTVCQIWIRAKMETVFLWISGATTRVSRTATRRGRGEARGLKL